MKQLRFMEQQIIGILREGEAGAKTAGLCRRRSYNLTCRKQVIRIFSNRPKRSTTDRSQTLTHVSAAGSFARFDAESTMQTFKTWSLSLCL